MLDPFILEQLKRLEEERRRQQQSQPQIELPQPMPEAPIEHVPAEPTPEEARGTWSIEVL